MLFYEELSTLLRDNKTLDMFGFEDIKDYLRKKANKTKEWTDDDLKRGFNKKTKEQQRELIAEALTDKKFYELDEKKQQYLLKASYDRAEKVLDNVDLKIESGELVGIIGSTGSGKTTLVSMIPRLYDVDEGDILVDGVSVKDYSLYNLREGIACVLQKNTLFAGTVAENLRWGNEDATDEELERVCKIAQAHSFVSAFEDGYETQIGREGSRLSGGQKQRLCIARALLKTPAIIILDDSTSAVDTATDASIRKAFRDELGGVTKLIIAQRIQSVMDADKIVVLNEGRVVGVGSHSELMKSCEAYREIYLSQKDEEVDA